MKKLLYYVPSVLVLAVVFTMNDGPWKWILLAILALCVIFAKYKRTSKPLSEVEYDDRVNLNIRYWSFGFLLAANAVLLIYLLLASQSIINDQLTSEHLIVFLAGSMMISLYAIPGIVKRF